MLDFHVLTMSRPVANDNPALQVVSNLAGSAEEVESIVPSGRRIYSPTQIVEKKTFREIPLVLVENHTNIFRNIRNLESTPARVGYKRPCCRLTLFGLFGMKWLSRYAATMVLHYIRSNAEGSFLGLVRNRTNEQRISRQLAESIKILDGRFPSIRLAIFLLRLLCSRPRCGAR